MNPLARIKDCIEHPSPKRVLLLFIGALILLQVTVLLLSQVDLPGYGDTIWSLVTTVAAATFGLGPDIAQGMADNFPFLLGALAVLGLIHLYWVSCRSGDYVLGPVAVLLALLSVMLFFVHYSYMDKTLPYSSSFFHRVSVFSAWALLMVPFTALIDYLEDNLGDGGVAGIFVLVCAGSAVATGAYGSSMPSVPLFSFQVMNGVMQLVANFAGVTVWFLFAEQLREWRYAQPSPVRDNQEGNDCV